MEIEYTYKDCYELQSIDANCNNCIFLQRDIEKFNKWMNWHKELALTEFEKEKAKAILDAQYIIDRGMSEVNSDDIKSGNGMMRVALKMRFQFDKNKLLQYGRCSKLNKDVSFIPLTCQIETQDCFSHRRSQ